MVSCSKNEQEQLSTWVSFRSAQGPLLGQFSVSANMHNINRTRMENLFHRLFSPAQIELTIPDRFGNPVKPREWFLVPLHVINEAVERIRDGSIAGVIYDPASASLRSAG